MGRELAFWLTVAAIAIAAPKLLRIFAESDLGKSIPGVAELAAI